MAGIGETSGHLATTVLEQRYPQEAVHVWVIDGGSTDRTVEIVREWERAQGRVTVIADGHRRNLPEALNVGLAEGRGELVAKVDAHGYPERDYIRRAVV